MPGNFPTLLLHVIRTYIMSKCLLKRYLGITMNSELEFMQFLGQFQSGSVYRVGNGLVDAIEVCRDHDVGLNEFCADVGRADGAI